MYPQYYKATAAEENMGAYYRVIARPPCIAMSTLINDVTGVVDTALMEVIEISENAMLFQIPKLDGGVGLRSVIQITEQEYLLAIGVL